MDATIRSWPLDEEHVRAAIDNICAISTDDGINFEVYGTTLIRDDDECGGFHVSLNAVYENINSPLSMDITAGDVIIPKPVKRLFKSFFDYAVRFKLWTYNTETILAEKIETILRRGTSNTRPRDFYDVYLITKTQEFDLGIFHQALSATSIRRKTSEKISDMSEIVKSIEENKVLKKQWEKYQREYFYANEVSFEDTIKAIKGLVSIIG